MIEIPAALTQHAALIGELRAIAEDAAVHAPAESMAVLDALSRFLSIADLPAVLLLLRQLAVLRAAMLDRKLEETENLWHDLVAGSKALRAPLIEALWSASPAIRDAVFEHLQFQARSQGNSELRAAIERPDLVVAAAGDFKRGKSTVVNSLIGTAVLPMRVAPATAVPCTIHAAAMPWARLFFRDDRPSEAIALDDLERYACIPLEIAGEELAFNAEITRIDIGLPWSLPDDLTLVDLPGLNEEAGRSELATEAMAASDAMLMVLSATQLLAEDELQLLDQLWLQGHRTFLFAINFRDRLEEADIVLVSERASRLLAPYGGILQQNVFLVSARQALLAQLADDVVPEESGMPALEKHLRALLTAERTQVWQTARLRQAVNVLEQAEQHSSNRVLESQALLRRLQAREIELQERHESIRRTYALTIADREEAIGVSLRREEEYRDRYNQAWEALDTDVLERCQKELLPWIWQEAGPWLRERMIPVIREVNPTVAPRPEGYLRIRTPSGLRLSRTALTTFYRAEAAREWDRFTGDAYRLETATLQEERTALEASRRALDVEFAAQKYDLERQQATLQAEIEEIDDTIRTALIWARETSRRLQEALSFGQ